VLEALGLTALFDHLPPWMVDGFLRMICPAIEVVIEEESKSDQRTRLVADEIVSLVRQPVEGEIDGHRFSMSLDDFHRCYFTIKSEIEILYLELKPRADRDSTRLVTVLSEARARLKSLSVEWFEKLLGALFAPINDLAQRVFRVDGPIVEMRLCCWLEPTPKVPAQFRLRRHEPLTRVVDHQGSRSSAYVCRSSSFLDGLQSVTWNCQTLGIDGPNCELKVLISKHAIERLIERLPLIGFEALLHGWLVESLASPVLSPHRAGGYLVEYRMGEHRLGYLVAEIHAAFILIKTFLFLTMSGTPESALLRERIGAYRADLEYFKLDSFFTLVGTDIVRDPLLSRVLSECGCGHLLNLINPDFREPWLESFGEKFKRTFKLAEAPGGFLAGQKLNTWST
jgi:hypothetical protein